MSAMDIAYLTLVVAGFTAFGVVLFVTWVATNMMKEPKEPPRIVKSPEPKLDQAA